MAWTTAQKAGLGVTAVSIAGILVALALTQPRRPPPLPPPIEIT